MTAGRSQPVLVAKIRVPPPKGLARERLDRALASLWKHRLGLVVAPAGSGKTTLLTHVAAGAGTPVAWYRAEAADASEGDIVAHLERALTAAIDDLSRGWRRIDDAVAALEEWSGDRVLIVVDDLHEIRGTAAEAALERLACNLPPSTAMLVATRRAPAFNLSRLRVSGDLLELGSEDLRFRSWEVEGLFRNVYGDPLPPEELAELARRTEGWAAGLQLFHLATRGKSAVERRRVLRELGMRSRLVREYLARNVLDDLDVDLRRFLLDTCVLGRLTAPLCDAFTGTGDGARLLDELDQRQIFTQPVGEEGAYRYHEVLRSHLEAALVEQVGEAEAATRYRRAGELLEAAGAHPEALRAYCRAEDWEAATRLLRGRGDHVFTGRWAWLDALPASLVDHDPRLLLASARRWTANGRWDAAVAAYERAEAGFGTGQAAEVARRERLALSAWLEPLPVVAGDWTGLVRRAVRRDPLGVRVEATKVAGTSPSPFAPQAPGILAAGLAALLTGNVRDAADLLGRVAADPEASRPVVVGARLAAAVAALLAGEMPSPGLEEVSEEADDAGLTWLSALARASLTLATPGDGGPGPPSQILTDPWGKALTELLVGLGSLRAGGQPVEVFTAAASSFNGLGAGVLEAWAQAGRALALARRDGPSRRDEVRSAERLARAVGAQGAVGLVALALAIAEPERAREHLAEGERISYDSGFDLATLLPTASAAGTGWRGTTGAQAVGPSLLLGRERELAELVGYLDRACAGAGGTVEVTGEPGIGKTRLLEELAGEAERRGLRVLWGRCAQGANAYWPWSQVLRAHLLSSDLRRLSRELGRHADVLTTVVPEVLELLPDVDIDVAGADAAGSPRWEAGARSRLALFETTCGVLERAARQHPLVVVLDDLHLADAPSLQLLEFLAAGLVSCPVLLVVAFRDEEAPATASSMVPASSPSVRRLRLGGLGEADVAALMAATVGRRPRPTLAAAVLAKSDGNPFFVRETARLLEADRRYDDPSIVSAEQLRLPASVGEMVARRLAVLSQPCRQVLTTAAVIGRTFTLAVLERASGVAASELLDVVGEAVAGRVVQEVWAGAGRFQFCQGLVQEALYSELTPAERASLHERVGEAIEATAREYVEPHLDELAHHFLRAGRSSNPTRAARYAIACAQAAMRNAAPEHAVSACQSALELIDDDESVRGLRSELLAVLGGACAATGARDQARDLLHSAALLAREGRRDDVLARVELSLAQLGEPCLAVAPDSPVSASWQRFDPELVTEDGAVPTSALAIRCFGGFSLRVGGRPVDLRPVKPRHRSVLHLLALRAGRPIHREQLVETFWPDDDDGRAGTRNLQVAISALRQLLEPGVARGAASIVVRDGDSYRLATGDDVDVLVFERAVEEGNRARSEGDVRRAEAAFVRALDCYGGDLLPDAGPAEWAVKEREHYRLEAAGAAQALAELCLERGDPGAAVRAAERGLRVDPYWDGLWRLLVTACEEAGDVAAAKRARSQYRKVLVELGLADG